MGTRNRSGIRTVRRGGRKILIIDFRFRDRDGREQRCRRDAAVQTMTGAHAEADRLKRFAIEHGTVDITPPSPTVEAFVRDQYVPLVLPRYSPATREKYTRLLWKEGLLTILGRHRVNEVDARAYRLLESTLLAKGVQPRQHLVLLRGILRTAVEHEVIERMPALPKTRRQPSKLPSAPSIEVVRHLIAGSTGWLRLAVAIAFYACGRSGEVRALRVGDVDFASETLSTRRAYSHDQLWTPKGRDERSIPIAIPLRDILMDAVKGKAAADLIVADEGAPVTRQALYKAFVALQRRLGVEQPWSFHALRHAFGTHAIRNGANVETIRDLMGHKDLETTARYLHVVAKDRTAAIRSFDGPLAGNG